MTMKESKTINKIQYRWTLRAALAPLAASPSQALPLRLPPGYGILWSSGRGGAQKGGHGGGTLVARGRPCPLPPRYRQPTAAGRTDSAVLAHFPVGAVGRAASGAAGTALVTAGCVLARVVALGAPVAAAHGDIPVRCTYATDPA